jgi:two-component system response regulator FixJ
MAGQGVRGAASLRAMDQHVPHPTLAIVDDDPAVRHALTFAFDAAGVGVVSFSDAESTLRATGAHAWRCLVLDQNLPGMSGLDLLDRLRARGVAAPAILITTNPSRETRARARRSGIEICEKPLLGDQLVERVRLLSV